MSSEFGLHPPVVREMSPDELEPYLVILDKIAARRQQAAIEASRRR